MRKRLGHPVADGFLRDVEREARRLPRRRRAELLDDLEAHLREAVQRADGDEAQLRTLVDALGSPAEIVAAAAPAGRSRLASRDVGAVLFLLLGGFLAGIGWFVGLVLLWVSPAWNTRQKLLGTLVWPGGLALPVWLWLTTLTLTSSCSSSAPNGCSSGGGPSTLANALGIVAAVVSIVAPFVTAAYLVRTARPYEEGVDRVPA